MIKKFNIKCDCGYSISIDLDSKCAFLRIYCSKCKKNLFSYASKEIHIDTMRLNKKNSFEKENKMLNQTADRIVIKNDENLQKKFDHYSLLKEIGEGSMGKVYLAIDDNSNEKVALKLIQKSEDSKLLDYFIREVQVLLDLNHPNIIAIKGWGNYKGFPYLAMEYSPGITLSSYLKKGPMLVRNVIQIIFYVLDALNYASKFRIIHRDIKPSNIMVTKTGNVKLLDFGISKITKDGYTLTKTGDTVGTAFYMPAEQLRNAKNVDFRADIYAVGATMYHLLSGFPPYEEYKSNMIKLLQAKVKNQYISIEERCPKLNKDIINIVKKAMSDKPEDRYQNTDEMKKELIDFYKKLK